MPYIENRTLPAPWLSYTSRASRVPGCKEWCRLCCACGELTYDTSLDVWFMPGHKTLPKATSWGFPNGLVKVDLDVGKMVW